MVIKPYKKRLKEYDIFLKEPKILGAISIKPSNDGEQIPSAIINDGQSKKIMMS
jgi:hypothetical protein